MVGYGPSEGFPPIFIEVYLTNENRVYVRYTTEYFDTRAW